MRKYVIYILKSLIPSTLLIAVILTSIIWLSQSLRFINLIVSSGINFISFIKLTILIIPSLLLIILPISTFIGILYVYSKLVMDSELLVLEAAGLNKLAISKPAFILAIFMTILCYFISLYLLPVSYSQFKDKIAFYRDNYSSVMLEEGVFNNKIKGLTIYVEEHKAGGIIKGILVYDTRDPDRPITIIANKGKLIKFGNNPSLELINGNRQEINNNGELAILYFDNLVYDLSLVSNKTKHRSREPQERYLNELLNPVDVPSNIVSKFKAEAHQRIIWPIYNIILTLIALIAIYPREFNRRGHKKRILIISVSAALVALGSFAINNFAAHMPSLTPLIYIAAIAVFIGSFFILKKEPL